MNWNKTFVKQDGVVLHYFYCCNKGRFKCKKSARATAGEDGSFTLYGYSDQHLDECRPSSVVAQVRKVSDAIKARVLADPTIKPSTVYQTEVFQVRDGLTPADQVEFDNLMPTRSTMNSSIFVWKRQVIPAAPDCVGDIDTMGPFFTLESGESMVKYDTLINDNRDRRLIFLSSEKILRAAVEMSSQGVMDATFKVANNASHFFRFFKFVFRIFFY